MYSLSFAMVLEYCNARPKRSRCCLSAASVVCSVEEPVGLSSSLSLMLDGLLGCSAMLLVKEHEAWSLMTKEGDDCVGDVSLSQESFPFGRVLALG